MKRFAPLQYVLYLAMLVILPGCGPSSNPGTTPQGGCNSGIMYQGREYHAKGGWKNQLNLEAGSQIKAVREVSDTMKIYLEEAANLCSLYDQGTMTSVEYANARSALSQRFAALVSIAQNTPPQSVSAQDEQIYLETIAALGKTRPSAPLSPTELAVSVTANGQELKSGDRLSSGKGFHIQVDVPNQSYIYIVLIDSSGATSRLYPSKLTGNDNPVQGTIDVPSDPGAEFSLDDVTGTERILVYAQPTRSTAIETMLSEVSLDGAQPAKDTMKKVTEVLTRGINVRKKMNQAADKAADEICAKTRGVNVRQKELNDPCNSSKNTSSNQSVSALGIAAIEFVINHI